MGTRRKHLRNSLRTEQDGRCPLCGGLLPPENVTLDSPKQAATIDHIIPRARGGPGTRDNIQLVHSWCNALKADT